MELTRDTRWANKYFTLPGGAEHNANFKIRFSTNADLNNERGDTNDILITANIM